MAEILASRKTCTAGLALGHETDSDREPAFLPGARSLNHSTRHKSLHWRLRGQAFHLCRSKLSRGRFERSDQCPRGPHEVLEMAKMELAALKSKSGLALLSLVACVNLSFFGLSPSAFAKAGPCTRCPSSRPNGREPISLGGRIHLDLWWAQQRMGLVQKRQFRANCTALTRNAGYSNNMEQCCFGGQNKRERWKAGTTGCHSVRL